MPDAEKSNPVRGRSMLLAGIAVGVGVMALLSLLLGRDAPARTEQAGEGVYDSAQTAPAARWQDNVLMADPAQGEPLNEKCVSPVLGSDLTRTQVRSITVLDSLEACPENAWDVSENGDGSVMAWTEESGDLFDLYIAGEGGVAAPADCSELFAGYENAGTIQLQGSFHTENTTDMTKVITAEMRLPVTSSTWGTAEVRVVRALLSIPFRVSFRSVKSSPSSAVRSRRLIRSLYSP